jgi:hypothetical protein
MTPMSMVDEIAEFLGKRSSELSLEDIQKALPEARRTANEHEAETLRLERGAAQLREKAYTPGNAADQAAALRQAFAEEKKAEQKAGHAALFIQRYANLRALEAAMQITERLKEAGLVSRKTQVKDWQKVLDELSLKIGQSITVMKQIEDTISTTLESQQAELATENDVSELEKLFEEYNRAKTPEERAAIQSKIEEQKRKELA